ncbi:hypothetical protein B0H11DRAFT_619850 [Mycena galericulata]|nr:hypothetical protein B0H11DRAFT_619850 [Mycena galericulata]
MQQIFPRPQKKYRKLQLYIHSNWVAMISSSMRDVVLTKVLHQEWHSTQWMVMTSGIEMEGNASAEGEAQFNQTWAEKLSFEKSWKAETLRSFVVHTKVVGIRAGPGIRRSLSCHLHLALKKQGGGQIYFEFLFYQRWRINAFGDLRGAYLGLINLAPNLRNSQTSLAESFLAKCRPFLGWAGGWAGGWRVPLASPGLWTPPWFYGVVIDTRHPSPRRCRRSL